MSGDKGLGEGGKGKEGCGGAVPHQKNDQAGTWTNPYSQDLSSSVTGEERLVVHQVPAGIAEFGIPIY